MYGDGWRLECILSCHLVLVVNRMACLIKGIVNFYNTRDAKPACPDACTKAQALAAGCLSALKAGQNFNTAEMGNLGLPSEEEEDIVNFLKTLYDGYAS